MPLIEVKNISKQYNIFNYNKRYISLRDKISLILNGKFLFFNKKVKHKFNALENINFNVEKGDILGIIGENGSGKSTLLKIISGVTSPSGGEVLVRGRITSMLEVGTGFHPELSGRENIFLNGAILGMSKKEIEGNFNEIVSFSGIKDFLDTPVKHYSSGMYTRLAFSVAVSMNSKILLIDEVLAVGDIEFQKKCLTKMLEITRDKEKTILFVSHDLHAIQSICNKCVLFHKGNIERFGDSKEVVQQYLKRKNSQNFIDLTKISFESRDFQLLSFKLENGLDGGFSIHWNTPIVIKIEILTKIDVNFLSFVVGIATLEGNIIYNSWDVDCINKKFSFQKLKTYEISLEINHNLNIGTYSVGFSILGGHKIYENYNQAILEVVGSYKDNCEKKNKGIVKFNTNWSKREI